MSSFSTYFCIGIFLLPFLKLRRCDVFADARWHFNKGAAPPPNHLSDLSQKRSVQILQNFAGNLSYLWRHIFLDKKSMVCLILLMLFLAIDFFTITSQKVGGLVQKNRQSQESCIATARGCSGSESMDGMGEAPARSCGNQRFTSPNKSPPPTVLQCTTRPQ